MAGMRPGGGMRNWTTNLDWSQVAAGNGDGPGVFYDLPSSFKKKTSILTGREKKPTPIGFRPRRMKGDIAYNLHHRREQVPHDSFSRFAKSDAETVVPLGGKRSSDSMPRVFGQFGPLTVDGSSDSVGWTHANLDHYTRMESHLQSRSWGTHEDASPMPLWEWHALHEDTDFEPTRTPSPPFIKMVTYGRPPPRTTQALQRTTASNVSMTQDLVGLELNCRSISRNLSSVSSWNERGERGERASGKGLPISAWTPSGAARRVHHDSPASRHSPRSRLSASVPRLQLSSQQSRYDGLVISTDRPGSRTPTVQSLSWKRAPAASRPVTSRSEEASRRRENTLISPFTGAVSSRTSTAHDNRARSAPHGKRRMPLLQHASTLKPDPEEQSASLIAPWAQTSSAFGPLHSAGTGPVPDPVHTDHEEGYEDADVADSPLTVMSLRTGSRESVTKPELSRDLSRESVTKSGPGGVPLYARPVVEFQFPETKAQ